MFRINGVKVYKRKEEKKTVKVAIRMKYKDKKIGNILGVRNVFSMCCYIDI